MDLMNDVLQEFRSGDNWESYSGQLEQYFARNNTPEEEKAEIMLAAISPSLYTILRDLCHPDLLQHKNYRQLSKILETHCFQQPVVFEERVEFHKAKQTCDETVTDWFVRIINLGVLCEFEKQNETILKDKFVSGLADQRILKRVTEENTTATLMYVVDLAVKMEKELDIQVRTNQETISVKKTNILDIPDEILIRMILYLSARERLPLANSCKRFKSLVLEDRELLRHLNFSKMGSFTSVSDIQQYFDSEITCQRILGVDIKHAGCMRSVLMLNNSIGRAINLVDINVQNRPFKDIWQLAYFLKPLTHVERLSISIDWRITDDIILPFRNLLEKPFSRLTYLAVTVDYDDLEKLLSCLEVCQVLRKLRIEVPEDFENDQLDIPSDGQFGKLRHLEVVEYYGPHRKEMKETLVPMLPDPEKWTDFQMGSDEELDATESWYLEKNVEVCEELMMIGSNWMNRSPYDSWIDLNLGWALFPELLLQQILEIICENVPRNLCCLSTFDQKGRCLLTIEEIKRLLKNPRYQVSYLFSDHFVERNCDLHLLASAFPSVTELVLGGISVSDISTKNIPHSVHRLRKRGCTNTLKEGDSLDSSFKMLVENTPHLKHFRVEDLALRYMDSDSQWDFDALYAIAGWKNLETLRLGAISITNWEFLIEIGKQCRQLRSLTCKSNSLGYSQSFNESLLQMLQYCRHLREFNVRANDVGQLSEVFSALAKNKRLMKVNACTLHNKHPTASLTSSIGQLLRSSSELNALDCRVKGYSEADYEELLAAVTRLKGGSSRLNLQIRVDLVKAGCPDRFVGNYVYEDEPPPRHFYHLRTMECVFYREPKREYWDFFTSFVVLYWYRLVHAMVVHDRTSLT